MPNCVCSDAHQQPVAIGIPGELLIAGAGVTRGYYRREELTQEKFVILDGERWYRSGDLARYLADGTLEFLGRIDNQVKIRGYRIELGEIEAALGRHPEIREALVIAHEVGRGDKQLAAYVVADQEALDSGELRQFLRQVVPEYMVPASIVLLDAFPLTPNGKIDRRALPVPQEARVDRAAYMAPRTEEEQRLANIWADILSVEQVGIHDHFFEMGGHSLLAVQLISRIRREFEVELPFERLFAAPTIAELSQVIEEQKAAGGAAADEPAIVPLARQARRVKR